MHELMGLGRAVHLLGEVVRAGVDMVKAEHNLRRAKTADGDNEMIDEYQADVDQAQKRVLEAVREAIRG